MSDPIIDSHLHLWDPTTGWYDWLDRGPAVLQRAYTLADSRPAMDELGVSSAILVQAADRDEDTDAMFAVADQDPRIVGVVGFVPLHQPERAAVRLAQLAEHPRFCGVRTLIHDQPDPDWLLRDDVTEGLALLERAGVPFDLVAVLPRHLDHVSHLAETFPDLPVVIDHLAHPPVGADSDPRWLELMRRAAENPRVSAKVSGLYASGKHTTDDDIRPWIDHALSIFGPDRLMIGSDWPVAEVAGGYRTVMGSVVRVVTELAGADSAAVLAGTAQRVYGVDLPA